MKVNVVSVPFVPTCGCSKWIRENNSLINYVTITDLIKVEIDI